jgi:hypothetical protein
MKKIILVLILMPLLLGAACNSSISADKNYYENLAEKCEEEDDCCLTSVQTMEEGGYKLWSEAGCPEGQESNIYRCITSYRWCEPIIN